MARRNQALVIGLIVGGAALGLFLLISAAVAVLVLRDGKSAGTTGAAGVQAGKMTRDEFKAAYMGKTKDEVLKALGRPYRTDENDRDHLWEYKGFTVDQVTGKPDSRTCIWFNSNSLVKDVNFY